MNYLICSDLHGDEEAFKKITGIKERLFLDEIISAGDFCPTAKMEIDAANTSFRTVLGNSDRYCEYTLMRRPPLMLAFEWNSRRVVITHGDCFYEPEQLGLKEGDIYIMGHTHIGCLEEDSGIIYFNPGSPSRPRDGRKSIGMLYENRIELLSFPSLKSIKVLTLKP